MPYLLIGLGLLLGLYGLYRFFMIASPRQMRVMIFAVLTGALALALFLLAFTGRLPVALAALSALWPIGIALYRRKLHAKEQPAPPSAGPMTRADALKILGLEDPASVAQIEDAYKRLMLKVHPDQQGSAWMAAQLNAARDFLLK